jgi:hypothetical protein
MTVNTFARWLLSSNDNNLHAISDQILPGWVSPSSSSPQNPADFEITALNPVFMVECSPFAELFNDITY